MQDHPRAWFERDRSPLRSVLLAPDVADLDVADLVERRVLADFRDCDLGQHGVVRERRRAHVVEEGLLAETESARAVRHHAPPLGLADGLAVVGLPARAVGALAALGGVEGDDVVARLQALDARADVDDDACALVPEDGGEEPFGVGAGQRELVGVAHAGGLDLDEDLAGAGSVEGDGLDGQGLAGLVGDGGSGLHGGRSVDMRALSLPAPRIGPFVLVSLGFRATSSPVSRVLSGSCAAWRRRVWRNNPRFHSWIACCSLPLVASSGAMPT